MDVTITVNGKTKVAKVEDLTRDERNAVAKLFMLDELRDSVFGPVKYLQKFRQVKFFEVKDLCPARENLFVLHEAADFEDPGLISELKAMVPGATSIRLREYTCWAECGKCKTTHRVTRYAALITVDADGLLFSKEFDIGGLM